MGRKDQVLLVDVNVGSFAPSEISRYSEMRTVQRRSHWSAEPLGSSRKKKQLSRLHCGSGERPSELLELSDLSILRDHAVALCCRGPVALAASRPLPGK